MKKTKTTFLLAEICLGILLLFCVHLIFEDEKPQKRVAVIVEKSGDEKWNSFMNGLKQAAGIANIHLIICNTDEIENADEEKNLIYDQLDNQVDAFIVQAAPGRDTIDMLREIRVQKPMLLVANDALREKEEDHISKYSDLPVITPDYYRMGYTLAQDLLSRNQNNIQGKTVGIISGFKKTDCTDKCMQGVLDVLSDTGCEIQFDMNITYDMEITQRLKEQQPVDYLIVFDTSALEQVAGMYAQKKESDTKIYGIGNSIKCVYYLDDSVIDGLIAIDGYGMGYHSAIEISKVLKNHLYTINNQMIEYHLPHKEDIMEISMKQYQIRSILIGCMLLCLTGCTANSEKKRDVLRVGVVLYTQDDPFINALTDCLKEDLAGYESDSLKVIMTVRDGKNDQKIQNEVVKEMLDAGCEILAVDLVDRTEPSNIIKMAKKENIPVIFFNREPVREDLMQWDKLYYVGGDARQSGMMQGEIAADMIRDNDAVDRNQDGKIQYVLLEGETGHQDAIIRTDSVVKTIKEQGIILERLSFQFANWNRGQAENKMTQLINQYGDEIELVLSNNDEMALGAVAAYDALDYDKDRRPIIFGIDGLEGALDAVQKGTIQGTVYNDRHGQAEQISRLAMTLFQGQTPPKEDLENERYIFLPYQKVTAENVESFMEQ